MAAKAKLMWLAASAVAAISAESEYQAAAAISKMASIMANAANIAMASQ